MEQNTEVVVDSKKWYLSKTFWVNLLALIAMVAQMQYGFVFSAEMQTSLLVLINMALRLITNKSLTL